MEVDADAMHKQRLDKVRILILRDPKRNLPNHLFLDVCGVRFMVSISEEDDFRGFEEIRPPESCHRHNLWPEKDVADYAGND